MNPLLSFLSWSQQERWRRDEERRGCRPWLQLDELEEVEELKELEELEELVELESLGRLRCKRPLRCCLGGLDSLTLVEDGLRLCLWRRVVLPAFLVVGFLLLFFFALASSLSSLDMDGERAFLILPLLLASFLSLDEGRGRSFLDHSLLLAFFFAASTSSSLDVEFCSRPSLFACLLFLGLGRFCVIA